MAEKERGWEETVYVNFAIARLYFISPNSLEFLH